MMDPAAIPFLLFKLALFGLVFYAWRIAERDLRRLRAREAEERAAATMSDDAERPHRQAAREPVREVDPVA